MANLGGLLKGPGLAQLHAKASCAPAPLPITPLSHRSPPVCGRVPVGAPTPTSLSSKPHTLQRPAARNVAASGLARQVLAQPGIEGDPLAFLDVSEAYWKALRNQKHEPEKKGPTVVRYASGKLDDFAPAGQGQATGASSNASGGGERAPHRHDYDVVICGGTLGLFLATALQMAGWRVAIVEKRLVQGRNQEWNISWGELKTLSDMGLLSEEELRATVVSAFNPIRVGFLGGEDLWTRDVLNLGVQPRKLLDALRAHFVAAGGVLFENTSFKGATIYEDGMRLALSPGGRDAPLAVGDTNRPNGLGNAPGAPGERSAPAPRNLTCRLLLDCMGHYSDIVKQIRGRVKPDGMCLVVGSCAEGFPAEANTSADLLYSLSHARNDMQLFWEAFPAEGGSARTTYMFAYSDAHPERPSFEQLLDTYFELLPQYQGLPVDKLRFKRVLFGGFPCYSDGPLQPAFDRVMQIGDASAAQSPLSFGGFGSMMRHLSRLSRAIGQALTDDRLRRDDLGWIQPYQPSLSASWLFQRSMSIGVGQVTYPQDYEHAPPYAIAEQLVRAQQQKQELADAEAAAAAGAWQPMALAATTGPSAAFQSSMAMVAGSAARFAAGSIDPDDYFHEEVEEAEAAIASISAAAAAGGVGTALAAATASSSKAAASATDSRPAPKAPAVIFERDFRGSPSWSKLPYTHVNEILGTNFGVMGFLGERVLKPFLQDTIQLVPLSLSMTGMMLANPIVISRVLLQVGPKTLASWFGHYFMLVLYSVSYTLLQPLRTVVPSFTFQRVLDALQYGSGSDFHFHGSDEVMPALAPPENGMPPPPAALPAPPAAAAAQQPQQPPAVGVKERAVASKQ